MGLPATVMPMPGFGAAGELERSAALERCSDAEPSSVEYGRVEYVDRVANAIVKGDVYGTL